MIYVLHGTPEARDLRARGWSLDLVRRDGRLGTKDELLLYVATGAAQRVRMGVYRGDIDNESVEDALLCILEPIPEEPAP